MFKVDCNLHKSPEVLAIPARWRIKAVGVWVHCGSYVAEHLTDGFVPDEVIKEAGAHRNKIREWLVTVGFWVEVPGGVQMQELYCWWPKREKELASRFANRRRQAEWRSRNSATTRAQLANNSRTTRAQFANNSATTQPPQNGADLGQQQDVTALRDADCGIGLGIGSGSVSNHHPSQAESLRKPGTALARSPDRMGRESMSITRLAGNEEHPPEPPPPDNRVSAEYRELVKQWLPAELWRNSKTRWGVETQVATLLNSGADPEDVRQAVVEYLDRADAYPGHIPHIYTELVKRRNGAHAGTNGRELKGADKKAAEWQSLKRSE